MTKPPFLVYTMMQKNRGKGKYSQKKQRRNFQNQAINSNLHSMFLNSIGDKVIKVVYDSKNYPEFINGNILYLHYYLQGKYYRGEACTYSSSHTYY